MHPRFPQVSWHDPQPVPPAATPASSASVRSVEAGAGGSTTTTSPGVFFDDPHRHLAQVDAQQALQGRLGILGQAGPELRITLGPLAHLRLDVEPLKHPALPRSVQLLQAGTLHRERVAVHGSTTVDVAK